MATELIGESSSGRGVSGSSADGDGVFGQSERGRGVVGVANVGAGVEGNSAGGSGVFGSGGVGRGVHGVATAAAGVEGNSASGDGVFGTSETGRGVVGVAKTAAGVEGNSVSGTGVVGSSADGPGVAAFSTSGEAVHAETQAPAAAAVAAFHNNPASTGAAIFARKAGSAGHAGFFDGAVHATGNVTAADFTCAGADCAEAFDVMDAAPVEPGTVVVLAGDGGVLGECRAAYDRRVAGVVSGAGNYRPGLVLDAGRREAGRAGADRLPVALVGKVFCKVDASYGPVAVGDLLTTSDTPGHAMRASDPTRAFGAVLGKALRPLDAGCALLPVLVTLQ